MSERLGDNQTKREAGQLYENVTLGSDTKVRKVYRVSLCLLSIVMLMILLGRLSKTF